VSAPTVGRDRRPALDGVRGAAILLLIAFHLVTFLPGGFLGVDVFFVLSGYLITGLLLQEHAARGRIRLAEFWARRARRLLPALFLLVGVTAIVVAASAPISTLEARRDDMVSALLYFANWHFIATDQSYFAIFTGVSPLRHVWTLAIEEQFYVVWPLLAVVALGGRRRPKLDRIFVMLIAGALASAFAMFALYEEADPSRAYFGTDARAHQLLLGAALAVLFQSRPDLLGGARARALARWSWPVVAVLVGAAVLGLGEQDPFYYRGGSLLFALVTAYGLWLIEVLPQSAPGRVLALRPLPWVGAISYGLYLWQWPMIVWLGDPRLGEDPWGTRLAEVAAAFAIATASFYLLERPIRTGRMPWLGWSRRRLAVATVVAVEIVAAVVVVSTVVDTGTAVGRGLEDRSDTACPRGSPGVPGRSWCVRSAGNAPSSLVVATAGDSTARALDPGLVRVAADRGWRYIQAAQGGCSVAPVRMPQSLQPRAVARSRECGAAVREVLSQVLAREDPDVWVVADRWLLTDTLIADGRVLRAGDPRRDRIIRAALRTAFDRLTARGARVLVIGTPPTAQPAGCAQKRRKVCDNVAHTVRDRATRRLARLYGQAIETSDAPVTYVEIDDFFCPRGGRCPAVLGGVLGRYDQVHLTRRFSRRLVPRIVARAERRGFAFEKR
jgi:peptidoglycan/LPS O-acetylase OafA/YrhL